MNINNYNEQQTPHDEIPEWLRFLFIIGGLVLLYYLLSALLNYLYLSDKQIKNRPRIFISHSWKNDADYWSLIQKFKNYEFEFYNHSIEGDNPVDAYTAREIEKGIENKMRGCSKVLVLGGYYANRYWIKKEIEIANRMGKEIIAIRPWGKAYIPKDLYKNANRVIGFNSKTIIENLKN